MILIYLASPYSHPSAKVRGERAKDITRVAGRLTHKYGHAMFLPITQSHAMKKHCPELGTSFKAWERIDLYMVEKADELWVVTLDGWEESIGVVAEIAHAKSLNKPIRYIHPKTLKKSKSPCI